MDNDLLILVKKLRGISNIEELADVKELGESFLRSQKREALLTLLSISEEMGEDEVLKSVKDMSKYLEAVMKQNKK